MADIAGIPRAIRACCNRRDCTVRGEPKAFKKCGACRKVIYCSSECQRADWKAEHKALCAVIRDEPNIAKVNTSSVGSQSAALLEAEEAFFGKRPVAERVLFARIDGSDRDSTDAMAYLRKLHMGALTVYAAEKFVRHGWKLAVIYSIDHLSGASSNGRGYEQFTSMSFGVARKTRIPALQESIAGCDPEKECVVIAYRLSTDKKALKIWIVKPQFTPHSGVAKEIKKRLEDTTGALEQYYKDIKKDDD